MTLPWGFTPKLNLDDNFKIHVSAQFKKELKSGQRFESNLGISVGYNF